MTAEVVDLAFERALRRAGLSPGVRRLLRADSPAPVTRLVVSRDACAALMREVTLSGGPAGSVLGISLVLSNVLPAGAWFAVDADGNVVARGNIG